MNFDSKDVDSLKPLIAEAVRATLVEVDAKTAARNCLNGKLGYTEQEAAALLSVAPHVLRDVRLRGEIHARKVGRRYVYSREALVQFLDDD